LFFLLFYIKKLSIYLLYWKSVAIFGEQLGNILP